jgi:hypothetical protein
MRNVFGACGFAVGVGVGFCWGMFVAVIWL